MVCVFSVVLLHFFFGLLNCFYKLGCFFLLVLCRVFQCLCFSILCGRVFILFASWVYAVCFCFLFGIFC